MEELKRTKVYKELVEKENISGEHEISERLKSVLSDIKPLLSETRRFLPEFTLHDCSHSISVLEIAAKIIPEKTFKELNEIELSLLIYAAFLHDIGMACSDKEKAEILRSEEFVKFYSASDEDDKDKVFEQYLRKHHAQRSRNFVLKNLKNKIKYKTIDYSKHLANICFGHTLEQKSINDEKLFPKSALIESFECNVHYIALILRLADYLDIFPKRAPMALYKFVSPENQISIQEWEKHLSISGWKFSSKNIRIAAECKNIEYERAVRNTIDGINAEKTFIYNSIKNYKDDSASKYKFLLQDDISDSDIKNDGSYIFENLEFDIDYRSVMKLLMGEELYTSPSVCLRELLQNAIDAINFRKNLQKEPFEPKIEISFDGKTLSVTDNGVGMDDYIFKNYFLKIGKSFYKSKDAKILAADYDSISEFGIGILSCFMVADRVEVESKRFAPDANAPYSPIFVDIPTMYGYMIRKNSDKQQVGTRITLHLKKDHPFENIMALIGQIAAFIEYPITYIDENKQQHALKPAVPNDKWFNKFISPYVYDKLIEIDFSKSKNAILRDIKGKAYILSSKNPKNYAPKWGNDVKSAVYQNGFLVRLSKGYSTFFLPYCAKMCLFMNLTGKAKLKLTANREDIIEDDKFKEICNLAEKEVADKIYKYLFAYHKKYSLKEYFEFQKEFLLKTSFDFCFLADSKKLSEIIYVTTFDKNVKVKYISVKDMLKHKKIIILDNLRGPQHYTEHYSKIALSELEKIFGADHDILPILDFPFDLSLRRLLMSFEHSRILCLSAASYTGYIEVFDFSGNGSGSFSVGMVNFVKYIYSPDNKKNRICLWVLGNKTFQFNANHAYFKSFINKEYNELQTELLAEALEPLLELNETNIISRYKEIFSKVWQNLKDNNIIAKNKKMPELTPDDLPLNQLRD